MEIWYRDYIKELYDHKIHKIDGCSLVYLSKKSEQSGILMLKKLYYQEYY